MSNVEEGEIRKKLQNAEEIKFLFTELKFFSICSLIQNYNISWAVYSNTT